MRHLTSVENRRRRHFSRKISNRLIKNGKHNLLCSNIMLRDLLDEWKDGENFNMKLFAISPTFRCMNITGMLNFKRRHVKNDVSVNLEVK